MKLVKYFLVAWMFFCLTSVVFSATHHKKTRTNKRLNSVRKAPARNNELQSFQAFNVRVAPAVYGTDQLTNQLNQIIASQSKGAEVAVYVKSMKQGDSLYSRNISRPLTPASTMKIFTAESALIYLGPEYRFSTQLLTDGKVIHNGILQGNLYIVLNGDPTLTYYDLLDLMNNLRSQQIQAIAGNVYIDNTAFDQDYYAPGWMAEDKKYCYGAPISASIINRNCISFQVAPSKAVGFPAQIMTSPKYFYPTIRNYVVTKTTRGRGGCGIRLTTQANGELALEGCMVRGRYAWGMSYVVSDLTAYNHALFKTLLKRVGVNVFGNVTFGKTPDNASLITSHNSKPLRLLINDMLKKSDNIIASALFKKMGQLYSRRSGSWLNGGNAVKDLLARNAGVNTAGMRMYDGSGLSLDDLTTPAQMMQVLDFAYHNYPTSYEFISSLPIAGVDGTLKHRMSNIARKVRAKTGTMSLSGVASLAGYAQSADKEPLAFVIMVNGSKGMGWNYKAMEDKIATALTRYRRN